MKNIHLRDTLVSVRSVNELFIDRSTSLVKYVPNTDKLRFKSVGSFSGNFSVSIPNYYRHVEQPRDELPYLGLLPLEFRTIMPSTVSNFPYNFYDHEFPNYTVISEALSDAKRIANPQIISNFLTFFEQS